FPTRFGYKKLVKVQYALCGLFHQIIVGKIFRRDNLFIEEMMKDGIAFHRSVPRHSVVIDFRMVFPEQTGFFQYASPWAVGYLSLIAEERGALAV
ncbi:MAG: hypothetical protein WCU80_07095, partial [Paludibacteraceae bacterium]